MAKHFFTAPLFTHFWEGRLDAVITWIPGTECFLVVSGFFLAHMFRPSEAQFLSVREFARRRGYRLLVTYWVALGLSYLGLAVWRAVVHGPSVAEVYHPVAVIANLLCVPDVIGAPSPMLFFWTVNTLIQVYALWSLTFWAVRWVFLKSGAADYHFQTERAMILLAAAVFVVAGGLTWSGQLPDWSWQLPRWAAYPAAGAFAHWVTRRRVSSVACVFVLALMGCGAWLSNSPRPFFGGLTGLLLVSAANGHLPLRGWVATQLSVIGEWSYSVYLMHGLVGTRVWAVLGVMGVTAISGSTATVLILVAMAVSLGAGWVLHTLVEKPMNRRAAAVPYRR